MRRVRAAPGRTRAIEATMLRIIRWVAWGAVGVVGFLLLATTGGWLVSDGPLAPPRVATGPQTLAIGGPFSLTDHRGRAVTERDFRGQPMAVFFGFTYCPDVCPTTLTEMTGFIEALGPDADRIQWVFVSVDAERDTPQAMASYLEAFDRRIIGLTGTEAQIAAAANGFRVFYRRVPLEGGGYTMDHSASVFLLDAEGRFAGTVDYKESERVALEKLRMLVGRR
jgi:protein SCO1